MSYLKILTDLNTAGTKLQGREDALKGMLRQSVREVNTGKGLRDDLEQIQTIVQTVGKQTQDEVIFHINDIVTSALAAVFDRPYEFVLEFVARRGKSEAQAVFRRGEDCIDPMTESGGGAVDVAAFALRIALWCISTPRPRPVIVLDEPLRYLSAELQPRAGAMIRGLSERLGLQFIVVTHNENLVDAADRTFRVENRSGRSRVECLEK